MIEERLITRDQRRMWGQWLQHAQERYLDAIEADARGESGAENELRDAAREVDEVSWLVGCLLAQEASGQRRKKKKQKTVNAPKAKAFRT